MDPVANQQLLCFHLLKDIRRCFFLVLWLVLHLSSRAASAFEIRRTPLLGLRNERFCQSHQSCRIGATSRWLDSASTASEVRNQFGLHDRFDRWRFLQNMLDEDISASDTQLVLVVHLENFLKFPARPVFKPGSDETGSPVLTEELRENIESLLQSTSDLSISDLIPEDDKVTEAVEENPSTVEILGKLERLLPDPVEEEDAFKSLWDTVIALHGMESVKINERNASLQWKARCMIARVLLHYDFLIYGLLDEPLA